MKTLCGHIITRDEGEDLENVRKEFLGDISYKGWITVNPGNWTLPQYFDQVADKIYKYRFRDSDIIVETCPKSGTTWVQEIIWTMKNNPNLDNPSSKLPQGERSQLLEMDTYTGTEGNFVESFMSQNESINGRVQERESIFLKVLDTLPSPRIIKTHLPLSLLPPDTLDCCKLVYVARNPYDVCISYYHFCRLVKGFNFSGTFDQFAQRFIQGKLLSLPFWEHVYEAWCRRDHRNLHFIFYENLKKDPYTEIKKLSVFLQTGLTDEQLNNVVNLTSFLNMKKRGVVPLGVSETPDHMNMDIKEREGGFLRKGIVGDWKNCSNPETLERMKKWSDDKMKDMEIPFIYNIN